MGPAAPARDLDEPVVVGERAPAVGAAGERGVGSPSNARSAQGRRGRCWARRAWVAVSFEGTGRTLGLETHIPQLGGMAMATAIMAMATAIMELMRVSGLTRLHVTSYKQKYAKKLAALAAQQSNGGAGQGGSS